MTKEDKIELLDIINQINELMLSNHLKINKLLSEAVDKICLNSPQHEVVNKGVPKD